MSDDNTTRPTPSALEHADRVGREAASTGFDWPDALAALDKVREEIVELDEAIRSGSRTDIREEFGDLLFAASSVARLLDIESESVLHEATRKFERRFELMHDLIAAEGRKMSTMSLEDMERFWQRVKSEGTV